jgi:hypothetical protein
MKFSSTILFIFAACVCVGQKSSAAQEKTVRPSPPLADTTSKWMSATRARKPLSVLTITNYVSQISILTVTDRVNANCGIDCFIDGYCGLGARLEREYFGRGSLVAVSFAWDQKSKRTIISMYGTDVLAAEAWARVMTKALRARFGEESVQDRNKK